LRFDAAPEARGRWDADRIEQVVDNAGGRRPRPPSPGGTVAAVGADGVTTLRAVLPRNG